MHLGCALSGPGSLTLTPAVGSLDPLLHQPESPLLLGAGLPVST